MQCLNDFFREEETRLIEKAREEIAKEKAEWEAKTQEERDEIIAKRDLKFEFVEETENYGEDEEDDDE